MTLNNALFAAAALLALATSTAAFADDHAEMHVTTDVVVEAPAMTHEHDDMMMDESMTVTEEEAMAAEDHVAEEHAETEAEVSEEHDAEYAH